MHQREHDPPVAVSSKSSCSVDGGTDTEVHVSFLSRVVTMVSWSLGHWGYNLESPNRLTMKINKTAAHFSLLSNLYNSFHVYKLGWLCLHAYAHIQKLIIAVIQIPDTFLGDDGLAIFLNSDAWIRLF